MENFYLSTWCNLTPDTKLLIITDEEQLEIAGEIAKKVPQCEVLLFSSPAPVMEKARLLTEKDCLMVLLSIDTYINKGAGSCFSPFGKPEDVKAQFLFVRLGISKTSFFQGIATPKAAVYEKIAQREAMSNSCVKVSTPNGTDLSMQIKSFVTCSHEVGEAGYAFLPPSETSAEVVPYSAEGKIVVDVTVGQLYYNGRLLSEFGLVPSLVTLEVRNGKVTDIWGDAMAQELKEQLFALPEACRDVVELGQGLSQMQPTGLIGVDESILDTCHFGIGDSEKCGMHLDVVVANPVIQKIE